MGPRNGRTFVNLENLPEASRKGTAAVKERSQRLKMNVLPVIREIQSLGVTTLEGIAGKLNERELKAPRGGEWHKTSVSRVLMTLKISERRANIHGLLSPAALRHMYRTAGRIIPGIEEHRRARCLSGIFSGKSPSCRPLSDAQAAGGEQGVRRATRVGFGARCRDTRTPARVR